MGNCPHYGIGISRPLFRLPKVNHVAGADLGIQGNGWVTGRQDPREAQDEGAGAVAGEFGCAVEQFDLGGAGEGCGDGKAPAGPCCA
jgi:hypothetical protein